MVPVYVVYDSVFKLYTGFLLVGGLVNHTMGRLRVVPVYVVYDSVCKLYTGFLLVGGLVNYCISTSLVDLG